jgi:hypothetical protein
MHKPRETVDDRSGVASNGSLFLGEGRHDTLNLTHWQSAVTLIPPPSFSAFFRRPKEKSPLPVLGRVYH